MSQKVLNDVVTDTYFKYVDQTLSDIRGYLQNIYPITINQINDDQTDNAKVCYEINPKARDNYLNFRKNLDGPLRKDADKHWYFFQYSWRKIQKSNLTTQSLLTELFIAKMHAQILSNIYKKISPDEKNEPAILPPENE